MIGAPDPPKHSFRGTLEHAGVRLDAADLIGLRAHITQRSKHGMAHVALPGGFHVGRRGKGQETADSRAYVAGDDLRHVDRGATSRTGHLHIRTFNEERDKVTHLVADFRPAMLWGMRRAFHSVAAAHYLTLIGWHLVESGGRVGLLAVTGRDTIAVSPRGRVRGLLEVIGGLVKAHALALDAASDGLQTRPLDAELEGLKRITSRGSEIVIATGMEMPGEGFGDLMAQLMQKRHPQLLLVEDHALRSLPAGRYPVRLPDGSVLNASLGPDRKEQKPEPDAVTSWDEPVPHIPVDAGATVSDMVRVLGM